LHGKPAICYYLLGEGSLEVKLPTIWTDEKAEVGRVREEKRDKRKIQREEKRARKQKMQAREKGSKVAKHCVFVAPAG